MAAPTPTLEPAALIAGDTAKWLKSLPDYLPADGWVLTYTLLNATSKISITATASGPDHLVNVAAATTAAWAAGQYSWRAQVVNAATESFTLATGTLTVQAAFSAATLDDRSHARKTLANIEAYLENPNSISAAMYEIAGRKLQRFGIPDLLALRDRYRAEVAREDAAANLGRGLPDRRRVLVRFGP
ncbi:MAG: hypothetical protein ACYC4S_00610 [Rhodoferax sp.]